MRLRRKQPASAYWGAALLVGAFLFSLRPQTLYGAEVQGRVLVGSYVASEQFNDNISGSIRNDFAIISSRFYLKVTDWTSAKLEFVGDLRDKNDFFDKLNREKLELDPSNTFQARQLSLRYANLDGAWFTAVGRFPIPEAGAIFTDGAELGVRPWGNLDVAGFGGLNPRRSDQRYVTVNPNDYDYGAYVSYMPRGLPWERNFYLTHAYVFETDDQGVDRNYLFHNFVYQWNPQSRLITLLYLDFVPNTNVQDADILWQQGWTPFFTSSLNATAIDVIEYTKRRGFLERLAPSPYKEASLELRQDVSRSTIIVEQALTGRREADGFTKTEFTAGVLLPRFWTRHMDSYLKAGARANFVSNDVFGKAGLGYYSSGFELSFDADFAQQLYNDGTSLHPLVLELNYSLFFSRELFASFTLQDGYDEKTNIYAGFAKIGYRFGSREVPPIRDGAPPRGRL